jgi:fatty-acyl-CoA synthase
MLDAVAKMYPTRPYVVSEKSTYSYLDIQRWSAQIAGGLRNAGVAPGDNVAVVMANFPEFVALRYAIARVGAVAVPINYFNRAAEFGYVLKQSDATLLVTMDRFRNLNYLEALDEVAPGWESTAGGAFLPRLKAVYVFYTDAQAERRQVPAFEALSEVGQLWGPVREVEPCEVADIIYTSGTTGGPKGVLLTHEMLLRTAYASAYSRAFEDGRRILFSLPLYHVFGYVEGMLSVLFVGGAVLVQLAFDADKTLRAIKEHAATDLLAIPTMTLALLDALRERRYDTSSLTAMLSSGGNAPISIWDAIREWFGSVELTTGYGMTETTATATITRPDDPIDRLRTTNGRMRDAGVAGDPSLDNRLAVYRVVDADSGAELPLGLVGELAVKGPGVTSGYYNKPAETEAAFTKDGWFLTGDLGVMDPEGYISLRGRKKECYRCGGEQVYPLEVEDVIVQHPSVAQAYVVPVADARMGEVGVAYVVAAQGCLVDADTLIEHCRTRLAKFKVPKHVMPILADEVPVTPTGRPRKFLLANRAAQELGSK